MDHLQSENTSISLPSGSHFLREFSQVQELLCLYSDNIEYEKLIFSDIIISVPGP